MELLQVVLACEAQFGIAFEPAEDLIGDGLETLATLAGVIRRRSLSLSRAASAPEES
jgi:acyl carrier protein